MAKRFSQQFKAAALRLLREGVTTRDAQAQLRRRFKGEHVGEGTLRKWFAEASSESDDNPPVPIPDRTEVPPAPVAPAPLTDDPVDILRQTLADLRALVADARQTGNMRAVGQLATQLAKASNDLARIESRRSEQSGDVVTIPRAELERARQTMRERRAALAADLVRTGGVVCSQCGREIRIALAKGELEDPNETNR